MLLVSLVYVLRFSLRKLLRFTLLTKKHPSSCPGHLSTYGSPAFCWWPHIKNTKVAHSKKEHFASATKQKQISPTRYAMTMITSDGSVFCKLFALLFHQFLLIPRQSKSKKLFKLKVFLLKFKILLNLKMFLLNSRF